MKKIVLYIDNMNRGGAQRVMGNLAEHFLSKQIKVILVNDYPPDEGVLNYNLSDQIERVYLRDSYTKSPVVNNYHRLKKLRKLIKDEKPDVVLSFLGGPNIRMLISTIGIKVKKWFLLEMILIKNMVKIASKGHLLGDCLNKQVDVFFRLKMQQSTLQKM